MGFAAPLALLLLLAAALLGMLLVSTFAWKSRTLKLFAQNGTALALLGSLSRRRQILKAGLALGAFMGLVVALARPYIGEPPKPARISPGDILIVLDVSLSMAANDVTPSRLELAKQEISGLIDRLDGSRIGLVIFGGTAALRFPLTFDYDAARTLTGAVEIDSAPTPGSSLYEGLRTAVIGLQQSQSPVKTVMLLTDGEDFGPPPDDLYQQAASAGITIHTLGIGSPEGSNIPLATGVKRDRSGQAVVTRLAEEPLSRIAEGGGGTYQRASQDGRDLQRTFQRLGVLSEEDIAAVTAAAANDLTPYFVLLAFFLLLFELLIPERAGARWGATVPIAAALPLALLFITACAQEPDRAFDLNQLGSQLYEQSRYMESLDAFRQAQVLRPDLPELNINAGSALYQAKEYDRALRETQKALTESDGDLGPRAHFNMGNAHYMMQRFEDAVEAYKQTLRAEPGNVEAKINLELALQQLMTSQGQGGQGNGNQPPQPGNQNQPQPGNSNEQPGNPNQQPGPPQQTPRDPAQELRDALRQAGQDLSIEETLRILDALRERERELQSAYQGRAQDSRRAPARPERDW